MDIYESLFFLDAVLEILGVYGMEFYHYTRGDISADTSRRAKDADGKIRPVYVAFT